MLLDSFAWVEYFAGTAKGRKVRARLDESPIVYTCPTVLAELYSKYARAIGPEDARTRVAFILEQAAVVEHTADLGLEAGRIHAELKPKVPGFGMADAFVLAAARSRDAVVLTGDPHFDGLPDAELL